MAFFPTLGWREGLLPSLSKEMLNLCWFWVAGGERRRSFNAVLSPLGHNCQSLQQVDVKDAHGKARVMYWCVSVPPSGGWAKK